MSNHHSENHRTCVSCGWKEPRAAMICSQCGRRMDGSSLPPPPAPESTRTFSLRTLFLAITLVSVWLAVTIHRPGLGTVLGLLSLPALFRTVARKRAFHLSRIEWQPIDAIGTFFLSLTLMWVLAVVGVAIFTVLAFFLVLVIGVISQGNQLAILVGVIAAAVLSFYLVVKVAKATWPN